MTIGAVRAVKLPTTAFSLYTPYLKAVGAATHSEKGEQLSDSIYGSASWCPATSYDLADAAYEWSAGQYADATDSRAEGVWTQPLSQDLAGAYASFVNNMDLLDSNDSKVSLDETNSGVYTAGSYADLLINELKTSANNFVRDNAFPYTSTPQRLEEPTFPGLSKSWEEHIYHPIANAIVKQAEIEGIEHEEMHGKLQYVASKGNRTF